MGIGNRRLLAPGFASIFGIGGSGGGFVAPVKQEGTVTISDTGTSGTDTITSVDLANSIIIFGGVTNANSAEDGADVGSRIELTNATTVTAFRSGFGGNNGACVIGYTVLEYQPGVINSVQDGEISIDNPDTSDTVTITSVDLAKSHVSFQGMSEISAVTGNDDKWSRVVLTNATTVTGLRVASGGSVKVGFQVVEFV